MKVHLNIVYVLLLVIFEAIAVVFAHNFVKCNDEDNDW